MKTNIKKISTLLFVMAMAFGLSVSVVQPVTAFADEIIEESTPEITPTLSTDETDMNNETDVPNTVTQTDAEDTDVEESIEEPTTEGDDSLDLGTDKIPPTAEDNSETLDIQENVVEAPTPTEEAVPISDVPLPQAPIVRYNPIYLGGLNIMSSNWDHIEVTVTNTKTGEAREGYLEYRSNSTLAGYLTSGPHSDRYNHYKIETRIYMLTGDTMVINGSSTGTASNGGDSYTISFKAEGDILIVTPEGTPADEIDIPDPLVPLILLEPTTEVVTKVNPSTNDKLPLYLASGLAAFVALVIALACLVRRKTLTANTYSAVRTKSNPKM